MRVLPPPPPDGWTLKEALLAICPEEFDMYVAAERAAESAFSVPVDPNGDWGRPSENQIAEFWSAKRILIEKLSRPLRSQKLRANARVGRNGPRQEIPFDQWDTFDWFSIKYNAVGESHIDGTMYFCLRFFAVEHGGKAASEQTIKTARKRPGRPKLPDGEKKEDRVAKTLLGFFKSGLAHPTTTSNRQLSEMLRDAGITVEHTDRLFGYAKARAVEQFKQLLVLPLTPSSDDPPA